MATHPQEIPPRDYWALAELRYLIRRFLEFSESSARAAGVEPQQHQLLLAIKGLPPDRRPTIAAVAERLCVQHHSAVELVQRSIERGLVERQTSDVDRREAKLRITARGERVLRRLTALHRRQLRTAGSALVDALEAIIKRPQRARAARSKRKAKRR
jgi:DNA-binding MarR family transcriptional regulator